MVQERIKQGACLSPVWISRKVTLKKQCGCRLNIRKKEHTIIKLKHN